MRIAILSSGSGWHVRDLQRAAIESNHEAVAVDFRRVQAGVALEADSLDGFDAIIVRTMPPGSLEQVVFRMNVLHCMQAAGTTVLNSPSAIETCVDKYVTTARLAAAGLKVPETIVCQNGDAAMSAFTALGGDVVVKPLFGSEGRGMMRIQDEEMAWRTFRSLERLQAVLYLQRFIAHPGWDLRAFVMDGTIVAAMRRTSTGDWRTNVAQGGRAEPVTLTKGERELALEAAAVVGTKVAGIDLLPGPAGKLYVLEVNAVPGWRALSSVTGIDIAGLIIKSLLSS